MVSPTPGTLLHFPSDLTSIPHDKFLPAPDRRLPRAFHFYCRSRLTCLLRNRNPKSSSSTSSLQSIAPPVPPTPSSSPKALRELLVASTSDKRIDLYRVDHDSTDLQWFQVEELLTELHRSLLETHWALTSESEKGELERGDREITRSGKPSARQRRRIARRMTRNPSSSPACCGKHREELHLVSSRQGKASSSTPDGINDQRKRRIDEALATVTTLGLKGRKQLLSKEEEVILAKKMKVGQNIKAARRRLISVLGCEPSDEMWASAVKLSVSQLQSRMLDAERARDQMFVSNLRLVFSVANKYANLGVNLSDLIQEGALGLLRGLEKFNYKRGFKLSTYVHWWIRQGITRTLANHSRTIRLPAHMHERLNAINKAAVHLRLDGETVSVKSLSEAMRMSDERVLLALKATKKMMSLDKAKRWSFSNREEDSMHNYIADPSLEADPWIAVDKICMKGDVDLLLAKYLNKREREIVRLHYGLDHPDGRGLSLDKISCRYRISRERTRQIEGCAFRKLAATGLRKDFEIPLCT